MGRTLELDYPEVALNEVISPRSEPSVRVMITTTWPEAKVEEREAKSLHDPYPAWLLTNEGVIAAANLLSAWVWEGSQLNNYLGQNVFEIFSRNFMRVPKSINGEFFTKKTAALKRLIPTFGEETYISYINKLRADPDLWKIYKEEEWLNADEWETNREWQYPLNIIPPGTNGPAVFLEIQATVFRLLEDQGFFAIGKPRNKFTQRLFQQKYDQIIEIGDMIEYVQYQGNRKGGEETINKEQSPGKQRRLTGQERQVFAQLNRTEVKILEEGLEELRDSRESYLLRQSQRKDLIPSGRERAGRELEALQQKRAREKATNG